ncbi:MAG: hypothetical protein PUB07_03090 [Clostridia bacterium]|nr:hypothetical protein [Clostridia bacterium]
MLLGWCAGLLAILLALMPTVSVAGAREALSLCANVLIPSLFPFFVCTNLLIESGFPVYAGKRLAKGTKALFGIGGSGSIAILMGLISGYPAGAAITCRLYQKGCLTATEAMRLLAYTNNAGPLFVIGAVGVGVYGDSRVGALLWASLLLSSFFTGILMRFWGQSMPLHAKIVPVQEKQHVMESAVETMLTLCGYVVFFAVILALSKQLGIIAMLSKGLVFLGVPENVAQLFACGFFEISSAMTTVGGTEYAAVAMILAFGGLSVLLQTMGIVHKYGLSMKTYVVGKLISAGLAGLIARLFFRFFPLHDTAVASPSQFIPPFLYLAGALFLVLLLFCIRKRFFGAGHNA